MSMFEFTQAMWGLFLVAVPISLAVIVVRLLIQNGGLPVPETMAVLEALVKAREDDRKRLDDHERRLSALDGVVHLRKGGK